MTRQVILLAGGVLPAGPAYDALLARLPGGVDARAKELEVYATPAPPPGYDLGVEAAAIDVFADNAGFERFHLVGYSAGGASSLAYAERHPDRLLSLALLEPAFAGWQEMAAEERAVMESFRQVVALPDDEMMPAFIRAQLRPGVAPPEPMPGPPPPWMAQRPPALRAILTAFYAGDLDLAALRHFDRPVYFALGALSNPDYYERMSQRLASVFPDFTIEVYADRHHFSPPHRLEPERVAAALDALWSGAGA
jgi:pimeloyl-ACP methyl ester carboxylesterase